MKFELKYITHVIYTLNLIESNIRFWYIYTSRERERERDDYNGRKLTKRRRIGASKEAWRRSGGGYKIWLSFLSPACCISVQVFQSS